MRIIAGSLRARRLRAPAWEGLRPTSDKLRETLFNIIGARVAGSRVLDGYAGTGALGIEALSRGAATVVFVERDARAARLIAENLRLCGVEHGYAIIRADFARVVSQAGEQPFDVILLDPPYAEPGVDRVLARAGTLLGTGGLLVLEHARRRPAPLAAGALVRTRVVQSGDSALSFFQPRAADPGGNPDAAPSAR